MKRHFYIMLSLTIMFSYLLFGCSKDSNDVTDEEKDVDTIQDEEAVETSEEEKMTISEMEVTSFEDLPEGIAVKLNHDDYSFPYDSSQTNFDKYYGDDELIGVSKGEGIYRYHLSDDQVIWEVPNSTDETYIEEGVLYATQYLDPETHANVGALSVENGELLTLYEDKDLQIAYEMLATDDYFFMIGAKEVGTSDRQRFLIGYDKKDAKQLWKQEVSEVNDLVEIPEGILHVAENDEEEVVYTAYREDNGEVMFEIQDVKTINKKPIVTDDGIYFFDYEEDLILQYDFQGNRTKEVKADRSFYIYQQTLPVVTEDAIVLGDEEALVWYSHDLEEIEAEVLLGDSELKYLSGTEQYVYAIVSDRVDGDEQYYMVIMDAETGQMLYKVNLETNENNFIDMHVTNNKFHFTFADEENQILYFNIYSENVNDPFDE